LFPNPVMLKPKCVCIVTLYQFIMNKYVYTKDNCSFLKPHFQVHLSGFYIQVWLCTNSPMVSSYQIFMFFNLLCMTWFNAIFTGETRPFQRLIIHEWILIHRGHKSIPLNHRGSISLFPWWYIRTRILCQYVLTYFQYIFLRYQFILF
jgi:hypothetical protein